MKIELLIIAITAFFVANTYYDGKYVQLLKSWKKYYQMAGIAFAGISAYAYLKKFPGQGQSLVSHANGFIKHMPIDKEAGDLLTPLLNMTKEGFTNPIQDHMIQQGQGQITPQQKRMMNSGKQSTKRSVSETKKKYVASQQGWTCGKCKRQLPAWFEVDHKTRLEYGGSNHVDNLVALCRDCHGEKTAMENL
jgi:hypothetical protein|tara:strand:- start:4552 stop:5127 length:576 start_codon:yes stop_codon:yes gene_type:complete